MDEKKVQAIHILLIEDNPGDIQLTRKALSAAKVANRLEVVENGELALKRLKEHAVKGPSELPDLVLLDLNLPRKNGIEVLREIKDDPELRRVPVAVLTTSESEKDIKTAYDLHANAYIVKPVRFQDLIRIVKSVGEFWLRMVKQPPNQRKHHSQPNSE